MLSICKKKDHHQEETEKDKIRQEIFWVCVWWPEPWWVSKRTPQTNTRSTCGERGRYAWQKRVKEIKGGEEAEEWDGIEVKT